MDTSIANMIQKASTSHLGYIICQPRTVKTKRSINFNREAYRILSYRSSSKQTDTHADFTSLCTKWKRILDKRLKGTKKEGKRESSTGSFIELFKSGKRRYVVRGISLYEDGGSSLRTSQHMFILERVRSDLLNISQLARQWNLTQREQDLIQLLFADMSNKEICEELGLSLNTVKT